LLAFQGSVSKEKPIYLDEAHDMNRKHIFTLCNVEETV
jgi:hypothetical protein